jgi:hypothetical protein
VPNQAAGRAQIFHKEEDYAAFMKALRQVEERRPMRLLGFARHQTRTEWRMGTCLYPRCRRYRHVPIDALNGQLDQPTRIIQYGPDRALFINEHGSQAWGSVQGTRVWIPSWTWGEGWNTHQGLSGTVMGNRIVWPDGSFWSR